MGFLEKSGTKLTCGAIISKKLWPSRWTWLKVRAKVKKMADLTKLKPLERQILLIVGPSSVVWRFDDLSQELINHGIKSLSDPVDFIDYFDKRPTLFTVVNNHVWSKVAPRKMPTSPPSKQIQNVPSHEKSTLNSNFTHKTEVTESEKGISDNIKTVDNHSQNDAQMEKIGL